MDPTISDVYAHATRRKAPRPRKVLYVALQLEDPAAMPSRHRLDGIEVICFKRGLRDATRCEVDGRSGLVLQIPDPAMSSDHGRLVWIDDGWRFEDLRSKNGSFIGNRNTRLAVLQPPTMLQLGHTVFLFDDVALTDHGAPDVTAGPLAPPLHELVTLNPRFEACIAELPRVAANTVPILLVGETGSGKEVVARAAHALSGRKGALVAVNCGAIPPTLLEAELFGHKKGTFSGSVTDRLGHLRMADGGTLFLDEVAELPLVAQSALLRALQQREVVPVGDSLPVPVDFRVIAATHRDLPAMIRDGRFREDLYSRLLGVTIRLAALRERRCDLGLLIHTLLRRIDPSGRSHVTPMAARALFAYDWPRNVRELERALTGGVARSADGAVDVEHLPEEIAACASVHDPEPPTSVTPPGNDDPQRAAVIAALVRNRGNVTAAAKELGMHREQVHRLARRYGINLASFRR